MKHIVKRGNKTEVFDIKKIYASIYASCLSVHEPTQSAELIADKVTKDIINWLINKNEVSSREIRHQASKFLSEINPHAGYLYSQHRIMW